MARRDTYPLDGWQPFEAPHRPRRLASAGPLGRYLWPALAPGLLAALAAYVATVDRKPGLSDRGILIVGLAAVALVVLTARGRVGFRPLAATLAEYAIVAALVAMLAALPDPSAHQRRRQRDRDRERDRPALVVIARAPGNAADWISDRWREATQEADRRTPPPSTTRPPRPRR
jgi:hypothetical protein